MNIEIKQATPHIQWLSPRDQQIFDYCAVSGEVWAGYVDGELEACWGVIPPSFMSDRAYLWLLDLPMKHPLIVARHSREVIRALARRWDLHGHCLERAEGSCRWLRWLGAEFDPPTKGFIPFTIRRP